MEVLVKNARIYLEYFREDMVYGCANYMGKLVIRTKDGDIEFYVRYIENNYVNPNNPQSISLQCWADIRCDNTVFIPYYANGTVYLKVDTFYDINTELYLDGESYTEYSTDMFNALKIANNLKITDKDRITRIFHLIRRLNDELPNLDIKSAKMVYTNGAIQILHDNKDPNLNHKDSKTILDINCRCGDNVKYVIDYNGQLYGLEEYEEDAIRVNTPFNKVTIHGSTCSAHYSWDYKTTIEEFSYDRHIVMATVNGHRMQSTVKNHTLYYDILDCIYSDEVRHKLTGYILATKELKNICR